MKADKDLRKEARAIAWDNDPVELAGRDKDEIRRLFAMVVEEQAKRQRKFRADEVGAHPLVKGFLGFAGCVDNAERGIAKIFEFGAKHPGQAVGAYALYRTVKSGKAGDMLEIGVGGVLVALVLEMVAPGTIRQVCEALGVPQLADTLEQAGVMRPVNREAVPVEKVEAVKAEPTSEPHRGASLEAADMVTSPANLAEIRAGAAETYLRAVARR